MTALCGGGTSSPKAGIPNDVLASSDFVVAAFEELAPWLGPFAWLVDAYVIVLSASCVNDPPAMPTFDATDASNIIQGWNNPNILTTIGKMTAVVNNYAWHLLCQCDTPPQPSALTPLPPPPGVGNPATATSNSCFSGAYEGVPTTIPSPFNRSQSHDITNLVFPTNGLTHTLTDSSGSFSIWGMISGGVSGFNWQATLTEYPLCLGAAQQSVSVDFWDASYTLIEHLVMPPTAGTILQYAGSTAVPTNAAWVRVDEFIPQNTNCGTITETARYSTQVFCGTAPAGGLESCCPADPTVINALNQIMQLIRNLKVTGWVPPPSWTDGVRHAGLSNNGSFPLQGKAIGVRIEMKTLPVGVQVNPGTPTFYYDAGFITPFSNDTPLRGWRLVFADQSFDLPSVTDMIGYTLLHGTTCDIVELLAPTS
jgi:hypothetical protein